MFKNAPDRDGVVGMRAVYKTSSILRYDIVVCKNCGLDFERLITRKDKLCKSCRKQSTVQK